MININISSFFCRITVCAVVVVSTLFSCDRGGSLLSGSGARNVAFMDSVSSLVQSNTDSALAYIGEVEESGLVCRDSIHFARAFVFTFLEEYEDKVRELQAIVDSTKSDKNSPFFYEVIQDLGMTHSIMGNVERAIRVIMYGDSIAFANDDGRMRAQLRFTMGECCALMRDKQRSIEYQKESADLYEQYDDSVSVSNYVGTSLALMSTLNNMGRYDETLERADRLIRYIDSKNGMGDTWGIGEGSLFDLYAMQSIAYANVGRMNDAGMAYAICQRYDIGTNASHGLKTNCLVAMKRYDEALELCDELVKRFETHGDTVSFEFVRVVNDMMKCYEAKGDIASALAMSKREIGLRQKIAVNRSNSQYEQWEAKYQAQQREYQIHEAKSAATTSYVISGILFAALLGAVIFIIVTYRLNRTIEAKDRALASNVDKVVESRKRMAHAKAEGQNGDEYQVSEEGMANVQRFLKELQERKLYCDPDFRREDLLRELNIGKSSFNRDFEAVTGKSFNRYIATLRIELAAESIRDCPNYTIEAIAMESGISSRATFYRVFTEHFGISPLEYRRQCEAVLR